MSGLRVEQVRPEHLDDLDVLFSRGDPRFCQCAFMRVVNRDWQASTPATNRDLHHDAVRRAAVEGGAAGLIGYDDEGPAGWVSFAPRQEFDRLAASRLLGPVDDKPVLSVVCFVVAPRARRQGVARVLLDRVLDYARDHGHRLLEAYPVEHRGRTPGASSLWPGTITMFEAAGFWTVAERKQNANSPGRVIMRRRVRAR